MANRRAFRAITGATSAALALAAGCFTQRPSDDLAVVGQAAPAVALINEVAVNPVSGADDGAEFIELRGTAGGSLENVYVVVTDGDGQLTLVVNLGDACGVDPCAFGSNGLLAIGNADNFGDAPAGTTVVEGTALDDDDLLDSAAASVVLFESTGALTATAGDEWADLPNDITLLDAVGFALEAGTDVYGGVDLDAQNDVRAISRLGDTANSAGAWYYCEALDDLECTTASDNAPDNPALTPGDVNVGAGAPVGAGGAGGTPGTSEAGATSTGGIPAGGAAGAEAGTAGTATVPTAGAAGAAGAPVAQGGAAAEAGAAGKSAAGAAGEQGAAGAAASSGGTGGTGATSSGGSSTGGTRPTGGSTAAGGAQATGGSSSATGGSPSTGVGGTTTATGGETTDDYDGGDDDSGCGCRAAGQPRSGASGLALLVLALLVVRRRSQR